MRQLGNTHKRKTTDNMAKFPVEVSDVEGIVEGLNYVMSGPSGLGQNFAGYSAFEPATITGNFRSPYTIVPAVTTNSVPNADVPTSNGAGSTQITIADPSLLKTGMYVTGTGIAPSARIAVNGIPTTANKSTITLDTANTGPVSGLINFYTDTPAVTYIAPINLATIEWIDKYTVRAWFATTQPSAPFAQGNSPQIRSSSITDYNINYRGPGVVECTTTYVVLQATVELPNLGVATGGTIRFIVTVNPPAAGQGPASTNWIKTDCLLRATVNGGTDRVFLAGQLHNTIAYTATAISTLEYTVAINRYLGQPYSDPVNPDYRFVLDKTIAQRVYTYTDLPIGSDTIDDIETVFASFIDEPPSAYYTYRIELAFRVINATGQLQVTSSNIDLRSLTGQVVKQ